MSRKSPDDASACPCGSSGDYAACCGRFVDGGEAAVTAEQLMRSRYSAFALGKADYLLATWHPATRPSRVRLDAGHRWIGLRIVATQAGGEADDSGTVEFVARFKEGGRGHRLQELSRFEKIDGRWYYRDGDHR
ncbi:YchJ family protein [Parahaliea mediterranea]|uniref:YchJ family protein n=1 Tax=Parahaliea mediterranea TaxID=651086 RepID=UPI000E2F69D5|nr:YchJ family protein [Parahaliea mediterranea]